MAIGRPKSAKPRIFRHTFRLNEDEELILQTKLRKLGAKQKSDTIRKWVIMGIEKDC